MNTPRLEQYPGYFPRGKKSFWTRPKVGISAALLGFVLGAAGSGAADETPTPSASLGSVTNLKSDVAELKSDNAQLEADLVSAKSDAESAVESAVETAQSEAAAAQRQAVRTAVKQARKEERAKTKQAVAAALAAVPAAAAAAPAAQPQPLAATSGRTDPQFSACYKANAAGYGPYVRGQDPEYTWYDDRDGDGVVCEY